CTTHRVPRLLAIDESELIHRLLKARLRCDHLEIHNAMTMEEGLEMAHRLLPEVILLEIKMPERDGFQLLSQLKSNSETSGIPVIVISGSCSTDEKIRCFDLGAMDFVTKPFDVSELRARVRSAVCLRQMFLMLAQRAQIDGQTGLWNRSHFDLRLRQEIAEASRHRTPLSLIMCDLDCFKSINDSYGHPYGDHVLEVFADMLNSQRASDIACRFGGEEFMIILPQTTLDESMSLADRLRVQLRDHLWSEHPKLKVTASFGLSHLATCSERSAEQMIAMADEALYRAKENGRDHVCCSGLHGEDVEKRATA
ncbi:MAG: diguanylate cyclase, partial [Planctomycetota bacterium]|nr:diguanylate cyclase [Planctomycetota bacterium]